MKSYVRINQAERRVIQKMKYQHLSVRQIAHILGRSPSSISREIQKNSTRGYNAREAEVKAQARKRSRERILNASGILRMVITTLLQEKNSPEAISEYFLPALFPEDTAMQVSHETIYKWLYEPKNRHLSLHLFTRRKWRQNRSKTNKNRCVDSTKRNIRERMPEANNKTEFGHIEGDLVVSSGNDAYILTLVDRKGKHLWGLSLPSKDSDTVLRGIIEALEDLPPGYLKSLTFDNGSEFARHRDMEDALGCKVFFADPYCSGQRGLNEHTNARIRQYLPKNRSFAGLTDDNLYCIIACINSRPRRSLGWKSPAEVFSSVAIAS